MSIATQHPYCLELTKESVQNGKCSRIQDGYLLRIHSIPRTKYEGFTVIVGPCYLNRIYDDQFDLNGYIVEKFLFFWYKNILSDISSKFAPDCKIIVPKNALVHTDNTKWFYRNSNVTPSFFDDKSYGFATIMTRGPWFHTSKSYLKCRWNLLEWNAIL
jgi:hypothetical protein